MLAPGKDGAPEPGLLSANTRSQRGRRSRTAIASVQSYFFEGADSPKNHTEVTNTSSGYMEYQGGWEGTTAEYCCQG
jgi:hypothetical protein